MILIGQVFVEAATDTHPGAERGVGNRVIMVLD
jgi:hypothetical protein